MMIIFRREWAKNYKSLLIWSIAISLFTILIMSIYQSFAKEQQMLKDLLSAYPEGFLSAFGIDRMDISTVIGFYGMEAYLMVTLFGSIYVMLLSSNILAKEENEKTIEFLLAKPVTRYQIISNKAGLVGLNILLFNLFNSIVAFISFEAFKLDDYSMSSFLLLMVAPFLLHLTFGSIGLLFSIFITKTKTLYPVSISIVLFTYFLSIIVNVSDKFKSLQYFSPFKYVDAADLITNGKIEIGYLVTMILIIITNTGLTYFLYNKKDITV